MFALGPLLAALLALALCDASAGAYDEYFESSTFAEVSSDPLSKIIIFCNSSIVNENGVNSCDVLKEPLHSYAFLFRRGFGILMYIVDIEQEEDKSVDIFHSSPEVPFVYAISYEDSRGLPFRGDASDPAELERLSTFLELRFTKPGTNHFLEFSAEEDLADALHLNGAVPTFLLVAQEYDEDAVDYFGRIATRLKGQNRFYTVDCTADLSAAEEAFCAKVAAADLEAPCVLLLKDGVYTAVEITDNMFAMEIWEWVQEELEDLPENRRARHALPELDMSGESSEAEMTDAELLACFPECHEDVYLTPRPREVQRVAALAELRLAELRARADAAEARAD